MAAVAIHPTMNDDREGSALDVRPDSATVFVDMNRLRIEIPRALLDDEEALKEWIWQNNKFKLLNALRVKQEDEPSELLKAQARLKLLDNISTVQRQYLQMGEPKTVFGTLLDKLLEMMDSEYGFIGEIKHQDDGTPFLQTHAITNIAWNAATQAFYDDNIESGLKFVNLDSLFGHVIVTATPIIANEPHNHPKRCGTPEGHPPLHHFLGIPFFEARGKKMNGMVGIANKPGGYSQADIEFLEPFTVTCSNLIQAYNAIRENEYLINTLEEKVTERTKELKRANLSLEEANRRVVRASQAQLQHFACMSHEIRTPLNCIMGLSSLLQDTDLNAYQEDSLKMVVSSSELLLTVVNDVLDYSKLESGNVDIVVRRSNLQSALDAVVYSIAQKSKLNNLEVKTFYSNEVPEYVETDSRRLQQILYNLLGNAIKFSRDDGIVELRVELIDNDTEHSPDGSSKNYRSREPAPEAEAKTTHEDSSTDPISNCPFVMNKKQKISPAAETDALSKCPFHQADSEFTTFDIIDARGETLDSSSSKIDRTRKLEEDKTCSPPSRIFRFSVKDYGTGINKKDFSRIFKPFKQANQFTEQLYGGTGLGLAITSKLVNGLGGRINVDSAEGEWSMFTVDFPFESEATDIRKLAESLNNSTILLLANSAEATYVERNVFDRNQIHYVKFSEMIKVRTWLGRDIISNHDRYHICLVQEDLYKPEVYRLMSKRSNFRLVTFGPKYCVKETNHHLRSLNQVLPCVLIRSLVDQLKSSKSEVMKGSESADPHPIAYNKINVLIAEDNVINQKVLNRMLNRLGVQNIDIVDNGQKAVDIEAKKQDYDVVFMDMQMPIMDGMEACKQIVSRRGSNALPKVIFVTANVSCGYEAEAQNAGADGFISKPFNMEGIGKSFNLLG